MAVSADNRLATRTDLAWAISVGGIGVVGFAALLLFTWYFAATLFLIFAGMLLGVALNAMTQLLGGVVRLPFAGPGGPVRQGQAEGGDHHHLQQRPGLAAYRPGAWRRAGTAP